MSKFLTIFFDVEDPYGDHADDAALDLAHACDAEGVRATFCVTGEKTRVLRDRGRRDIVEAYQAHALGFHTNRHSIHPTTMEMLEGKSWEEGIQTIIDADGSGVEDLAEFFGKRPMCWAGAGFTWGPHVTAALDSFQIPAYVYARTAVPGGMPHRFLGKMAFPHHAFVLERELESRFKTGLAYLRCRLQCAHSRSPWVSIFGGHPTRMRYTEFWDAPFNGGVNPNPYPPVAPKSPAAYQEVMSNLRWFLRMAKRDFRIIGIDEAQQLPWKFNRLPDGDLVSATALTLRRLQKAQRWPIHKPDLNIDGIVSETLRRLPEIEVATI